MQLAKEKKRLEFRYYTLPIGEYVLPKLGKGWEQEYGVGYEGMLHFHNYLEIGYCYHGKGKLTIEDRDYRYGDDMFSVIPANIPHTTNSDIGNICKWEFLFIDMDEFIRNEMKSDNLSRDEIIRIVNKRGTLKSKANHPIMAKLILDIIRESREKSLYSEMSIKGYLMALVIEILRLDEERELVHKNMKLTHYIESAIKYVNDHYQNDIKIDDMAKVCGLSESHFRRVFEESMNMKPVDYVNMIRIQKACAIINKEDLSMEEVGFRVGYQTPSTFNRNFKKITGQTPYQWKGNAGEWDNLQTKFNISALKGWEA